MQSSCDKILTNYKLRKATFGPEETGYVTRIGSRTSSNYYRIYQTEQGLKFELELKTPLVKLFQSLNLKASLSFHIAESYNLFCFS